MRILHISPAAFSPESIVGGGERYALELARALASKAEVTLLSFARPPGGRRDGELAVEQLEPGVLARRWHPLAANPLSRRFVELVRWAEVVHAHQVATFATAAALLAGRLLRRPTFVTDLGGGHPYAPTGCVPLLRGSAGLLLLSAYSKRLWEAQPEDRRPARCDVVYGGVDARRFSPAASREPGKVLFVGRLLPHKGIEYLIEAVEPPLSLTLVGRSYSEEYTQRLRARAVSRPVTLLPDVADEELIRHYQTSMVTVLPSVYRTADGGRTDVPELLGLAALESMACGTPVLVTNVASLPEIVTEARTGFVVPPNDPVAIRDRLRRLYAEPGLVESMGRAARQAVLDRFTWPLVADRCLAAYDAALSRGVAPSRQERTA